MQDTMTAIELHLAREAVGAALEAWVVGAGSEDAVTAAAARLDRLQLATERVAFAVVPSHYATNGGR